MDNEITEGIGISDNNSAQTVPTDNNNNTQKGNTQFVTNILYENNGSVYGMEILLFNREDKTIEKILVTDETEFDGWKALIDNLNNAYVYYTDTDINLLKGIKSLQEQYSGGEITLDTFEYELEQIESQWSDLKNIGSLTSILANEKVNNEYPVKINATTLDGLESEEYSKVGHSHDDFATVNHAYNNGKYGLGNKTNYGHVKLVDSLTHDSFHSGEALSAYQGYVLKQELDKKNEYAWTNFINIGTDGYMRYKVNESLKLVVFEYNRTNYTGLAKKKGLTVLHESSVPSQYLPTGRALTPLYRGDVVLYVRTTGDVNIYNLTAIPSMNIYAQLIWSFE